jgi:malonyl-CoA/methylmalonyl-CoA synthetase
MILSTKEHHDTMDGISTKCSAHCSLLPSVASIPTETNSQESSSNDMTSSISSLIAEINSANKIKGELVVAIFYS